ncbi:MAG: amino acid adenylation domain-containing protein [Selenomonas ruminantium]|jgi:amino acid adenylation domain-containing protein|uniref:Amino acid adenylation domain-containing protein n=1 Tax=Selenomonas ruminantium TaxID=971 RepID=A0A927WI66_SELRU|nr:amino acid adenylation domain-containing protein [Selenomonas ruminantium]MBE6084916.1 amino acid adenylation domain-containing protein [Selenomonas ruminantium]
MTLVTDYLDKTAAKFPNKVAFANEKSAMTFGTLRKESRQIAAGLMEKNIFRRPVVIYLEKSPECVAAFMGAAYSGNFYTPLDIDMPKARIEKILATLQPEIIITDGEHYAAAQEFADNIPVAAYEDFQKLMIDEAAINTVTEKITDTDVLYVLFTSGSTGVPKGVIIPHRGVIAYTEWCAEEFALDENIVLGNQTPFYFSMSVLDIFQTLRNGCTTYIIPRILFSFPVKLLQFLSEKNINMIYWVPSALCIVANLKALGRVEVPSLKRILFAGEVMPTKQLNMWRKTFPDCLFADLYGPTETTDICAFYKVNRDLADNEPVPIGKACHNTGLLVLDEKGRLVEDGRVGELCVYGSTLAYGYYNNREKTAAAFVQNPLQDCYSETIYRTGDLVRYNEHGELMYVSRKDFQIKHMGHRIELGEIETAVSSIAGVERCACVYDDRRSKIVLFYTGTVEGHDISEQLKNMVPEYMLPNRKEKLDSMPINLNGKIDRVTLKNSLG